VAALERFVSAQNSSGTYARALSELQQGKKLSHWMWFIFPQIAGLGFSEMSRTYAIASLQEARAYLAHPILGPRLLECTQAVVDSKTPTAELLMGSIDAVKLRSCMTLFARANPEEPLFQQVLDRYFKGESDPATDQRLS
jgi:uncharacterized protein (DUF1810 family)